MRVNRVKSAAAQWIFRLQSLFVSSLRSNRNCILAWFAITKAELKPGLTFMSFAIAPKTIVGVSISMLMLSAFFGALNSIKVKRMHAEAANLIAAKDTAERRRFAQEKEFKSRETTVTAESAKFSDAANKAAKAAADIAQLQKEKIDLQNRLQTSEAEVASLQKSIEEAGGKPAAVNPGAPSTLELQAQLDDARHQLDSAEQEKSFLSEKLGVTPATERLQPRASQIEERKKRHPVFAAKPGVRGTILAVNQAYNFVVLNLGGRQGVEPNSEMLVLRDGALIGKIRISSVEPTTAIGDILSSSLARGVQVQRGDLVIYAGTNP
jgi:hypothetical protein